MGLLHENASAPNNSISKRIGDTLAMKNIDDFWTLRFCLLLLEMHFSSMPLAQTLAFA